MYPLQSLLRYYIACCKSSFLVILLHLYIYIQSPVFLKAVQKMWFTFLQDSSEVHTNRDNAICQKVCLFFCSHGENSNNGCLAAT